MININPERCNLCGGKVIFTTNAVIYGREHGSGYCYLCTVCGAYVGTHTPRPHDALGILANDAMRQAKMRCHDLFDIHWINKGHDKKMYRSAMYKWLAKKLKISVNECHFGYFDLDMLNQAACYLEEIKERKIRLNSRGYAKFDLTE